LLLAHPEAIDNPSLPALSELGADPDGVLATIATVIAPSRDHRRFSFTRQAIQPRALPRLAIRHTSESVRVNLFAARQSAAVRGVLL